MAGQPETRARREAAAAGIDLVALNPRKYKRPQPVETFGIQAAEDVAKMRACDALFLRDGDVRGALVDLGYDVKYAPVVKIAELAREVFDADVIAAMHKRLGNVEAHKNALVARQIEIAKHAEPDVAVRAFQSIARIAGWIAPLKLDVKNHGAVVNIHTVMQNPELLSEAIAALSHEPGAAIAASSEARERFERRQQAALEGAREPETIDGEEVVSDGRHE